MHIFYLTKSGVSFIIGKSAEGCDMHQVYCNNLSGRATIVAEQPPEIVAQVMAVWGDKPTVPDYVPEPIEPPTTDQQIAALKLQIAASDYKIIKFAECQLAGLPAPYDIVALHAERQALRDQINHLETDNQQLTNS